MMRKESPLRALLTVLVTAVVCSFFVSASVVLLRPIQLNNKLLERSVDVLSLTGLLPADGEIEEEQLLDLFKGLDARVVNIDDATLESKFDPYTFDGRKAAADPDLSVAVPPGEDVATLGRRSQYKTIYVVWKEGKLDRVVLPIRGAGMWSMIYGYISLDSDFNTIAGIKFYEQNETPGLGDQIATPHWQAKWVGKRLYDEQGEMLFRVSEGLVKEGASGAEYQVDALTGATITTDAVTALMRYWFGPNGYGALLERLREQPPQEPAAVTGREG
ncbi:MAG: Na(+)-translocating NADH-quinone reductase subunit C [Lysobacterales bacterium]|jgi:Na+-transporting NADH:ubiquinone oxidoreductase subunit C